METVTTQHWRLTGDRFTAARRSVRALLVFAGTVTMAAAPTAYAQTSAGPTASVLGTVMADGSERRLSNAEVQLTDLQRSTRSDSAGNFEITGIPAGPHSLTVRLFGYETFSATVTLRASEKLAFDVLMTLTSTKLKKVEIRATNSGPFAMQLAEFDERRLHGAGRYLTWDYFEKQDGRAVSSFLREKLPGINVIQSAGRHWLASGRSGCTRPLQPCVAPSTLAVTKEKIPSACYSKVVLNGRVVFDGDGTTHEMFDIDRLNARDIIGMEYYTDATAPSQYSGTNQATCGTFIIWTKGG